MECWSKFLSKAADETENVKRKKNKKKKNPKN